MADRNLQSSLAPQFAKVICVTSLERKVSVVSLVAIYMCHGAYEKCPKEEPVLFSCSWMFVHHFLNHSCHDPSYSSCRRGNAAISWQVYLPQLEKIAEVKGSSEESQVLALAQLLGCETSLEDACRRHARG